MASGLVPKTKRTLWTREGMKNLGRTHVRPGLIPVKPQPGFGKSPLNGLLSPGKLAQKRQEQHDGQ